MGSKLDTSLDASLRKHEFVEELTRVLPRQPSYDPDQLVAWLISDGATTENVEHVLEDCMSMDFGSDDQLRERLEMWDMYEQAAKLGMLFPGYLAILSKRTYESYKELVETNRLCIKILRTFRDGKDFIQLCASGDPRCAADRDGRNAWNVRSANHSSSTSGKKVRWPPTRYSSDVFAQRWGERYCESSNGVASPT